MHEEYEWLLDPQCVRPAFLCLKKTNETTTQTHIEIDGEVVAFRINPNYSIALLKYIFCIISML